MNSETEVKAREDVFQRAVQICSPRLAFYKEELRTYATRCRMELRKELPDDSVSALRSKLKKLSEPRVSFTLARIVDICYDMRGHEVDAIKKRSTNSKDDFGSLAHYIGRLGATRSSVNTVVRAMNEVPSLRRISVIRVIDAPEVRFVTLSAEDMVPYEIVWAISKDSVSQNTLAIQSALHNLIYLDPPSTDGSDNSVRIALAARRTIQTRVHAELQIGDYFSRRNLDFVDGDKYIGCSKPACYFCYIWLISHNHHYVQPATHSKIIPGCRGPDNHINESGVAILKEMYTKMTLRVGQDILDFLLNGRT
ncbi:OTT 1508-like deaminase [Fusarium mundagurra]|uniref:OTT 1508-like deaminase n=1 Tax=Fusarium mundagurra TaxID=1567541 RepID=A0A8H5XVR8_9HYPO|nr:OTT 1508-like deaminase [Fusarium mundagurra]